MQDHKQIDLTRRSLLATGGAATAVSVAPRGGATAPVQSAASGTAGSPALQKQTLRHITAGDLDVAFYEAGPPDGRPVVLLHGFPYDAHSYDKAAAQLADAGMRCIVPYLRGCGPTRFRSKETFRSGQQAALGADLIALLDALAIQKAILAGYDWGGRAACVVAALRPDRVDGLVSCGTAYNVQDEAGATTPIAPEKEHRHWYWYYLNSDRGRNGLTDDRAALCRYLWRTFSPTWSFNDADYAATVGAFDNPDFVEVVIHSYRVRIGSVPGDPKWQDMERQLSAKPDIVCPTVVLMGAQDGVDPPTPRSEFSSRFKRLKSVFTVEGAGHNLPQEAPAAFAEAVLSLARP